MPGILNLISIIISIYMILIIVRIILTWFRGSVRIPDFLLNITDPYLNWFRRLRFLRFGNLDFSPIAAIAVLSIVNQIVSILARHGSISLGIILALFLQIIWSLVSFFMIFMIIILVLRLIAYLFSQNTYSFFWGAINMISQPLLFRINQTLFKGRIINYRTSLVISIIIMAALYFALRMAFSLLSVFLAGLPL